MRLLRNVVGVAALLLFVGGVNFLILRETLFTAAVATPMISGAVLGVVWFVLWLAVWLSLRPLRILCSVCRILSGTTLELMVRQSDECAARLVGSKVLAETVLRRASTIESWSLAHERVKALHGGERLPDNIPLLVARNLMQGETNFTLDNSGWLAFHRWPQWGHCGSNMTYTVLALISGPTVKPLPLAAEGKRLGEGTKRPNPSIVTAPRAI